jgi:hypothetical protein
MGAKDWMSISRQAKDLSEAASRISTTEGQLILTLSAVIESIGRIGAAQAEALEKELTEIKRKISKIERIHGT